MKLSQALRLSNSQSVAFAGAGGKTTTMFQLAREQAPALLSTTTHLGAWQVSLADRHFIWAPNAPMPDEVEAQPGTGITLVTGALEGDRYAGLSPNQMETLRDLASTHDLPLLIEADGARQKPLKAPAEHEPPIPGFVDTVVVVAGLSGLNRPLGDEYVHRAEMFRKLVYPVIGKTVNQEIGKLVTAEMLATVLVHPQGGLKNVPARARRIMLLNQADTAELQAQAGQMAYALLAVYDGVVVASLGQEKIWSVHEHIAGIILAAGEAARFGKPKQLLDYHGQSFIRKVAQTGLEAGLSPVIVVTGAHADLVEAELKDMSIAAIRNPEWRDGQSTSIRAGLAALPGNAGGAIFLLADQPQVTPHIVQALVERHATTRADIVAPLAADRRANPVLFDRTTFNDLRAITGDVGGRAIFSKYKIDYITWHDESLLFDVDTEEDYRKLLAWGVED
jgi:molybdenum cofactor cytidylyltransferase